MIEDGDNALGYGILHSPVVAFGGIKSYGFNNTSSGEVKILLFASFAQLVVLDAVSLSIDVVGIGVREITIYSGDEVLVALMLLLLLLLLSAEVVVLLSHGAVAFSFIDNPVVFMYVDAYDDIIIIVGIPIGIVYGKRELGVIQEIFPASLLPTMSSSDEDDELLDDSNNDAVVSLCPLLDNSVE